MSQFYVKVDSKEIAECLVKIAQKNGYEFLTDDDEYSKHIGFYQQRGVPSGMQFLCGELWPDELNSAIDFAEIIKRLEEKPSEHDGEISEDGRTWTINGQEIAFCEIYHIYHKMCNKLSERK